jgi:forkhead box protein J2/3
VSAIILFYFIFGCLLIIYIREGQEDQYTMEADQAINYVEDHQLRPEMDENGNPDWRNVWHNELTKLRAFTEEQDKTGTDPEWYRMMVARVRGGLVAIGPDGLPLGHPHGHPIDHDIPEDAEDEQEAELDREQQQ